MPGIVLQWDYLKTALVAGNGTSEADFLSWRTTEIQVYSDRSLFLVNANL